MSRRSRKVSHGCYHSFIEHLVKWLHHANEKHADEEHGGGDGDCSGGAGEGKGADVLQRRGVGWQEELSSDGGSL